MSLRALIFFTLGALMLYCDGAKRHPKGEDAYDF